VDRLTLWGQVLHFGILHGLTVQNAEMQDLTPRLQLQHVSKDYLTDGARVAALVDVSLDVRAGEFAAIVGRSGCGKSTLLNLAGAMDLPTSGRVLLDGALTSSLDDRGLTRVRREKVGFIFQSFQLLSTLSVIENVEVPLLLAGRTDGRADARERLARVGLEGLEGRMPHQLSGGQMQRVAIARALVHRPTLLLADEPTGNLDTATGDAILDLLRRLGADQGTTVVMATHSQEAASAADLVVRMRDGRIEAVDRR
jgi:ABC-type lipoprotein export system ATPase subunit